jgi:WD40 repeat protein
MWQAATGQPLGPPLQHGKLASTCLAVSSDGKALLTEGFVAEFRLWDAVAGKPLGKPLRHRDEVRAGAFSRDGKRFLTLSDWLTVAWSDTATGNALGGSHRAEDAAVAAFRPDGKAVLVAGRGVARLWDVATGKPLGEPLPARGLPTALAFGPDGRRVLIASRHEYLDRYEIRLWESEEPRGPPLRLESPHTAVAFRPDGEDFLTATPARKGRRWAVRLWAPAPGLSLGRRPRTNTCSIASRQSSAPTARHSRPRCLRTPLGSGTRTPGGRPAHPWCTRKRSSRSRLVLMARRS